MKRNFLPLLLAVLVAAACSGTYNAKIIRTDPVQQKAQYDLKAAIIVTPEQMAETVSYDADKLVTIFFQPYPQVYQLLQEKMQKLFSRVDIVEANKLAAQSYDILVNCKFDLEKDVRIMTLAFHTYGLNARNSDMLFGITSKRKNNLEWPQEAGRATALFSLTLGLATPIAVPMAVRSNGKTSDRVLTEIFSEAFDETVERISSNQKLALFARGGSYELEAAGPAAAVVKSDVDELPAAKAQLRRNSWAVVIGIESYRQSLPAAEYAERDARTVADYLVKVLGYPQENVVVLLNDNASNADLSKYFEKWLPNNAEAGSSVFVYYSGHGAPNPKTGDAYLVPYDGDPSFIDQTGYSLKRMYAELGKLPAKEVVVALDSCFSGAGGRSVLPKGARPLVMSLDKEVILSKNMTVLAAASGEQVSSTYRDKGHGLFTYYLLKGIRDEDVVGRDGTVRIDDLFGYLKPQVERVARRQFNNEQSPQLIGSR